MILSHILELFGLIVLCKIIYKIAESVKEIYFTKEKNFKKIYGEKSYAIITGSTDGIGLGFALHLAKRGFNLILISRNLEKLEKRKTEIKKKNPECEIVVIQADFKNGTNGEFYEKIDEEIGNLDVSVLVNNVGIGLNNKLLLDADHQLCHDLVTINCTTQLMMTKLFMQRVRKREKGQKSACIDVSSVASLKPLAGKKFLFLIFSFKIFLKFF